MKILVTGGAGFIASHIVDAYVELGHEVVVLDNLSTGKRQYVHPKARLIEGDITNKEAVQNILNQEKPEVLNLHAAHIQVGNSVKDPQFDAKNNILGLLNLMEAAKNLSIKRVLFASTGGAMYGNQETPFTESMREEPLSPYGVSKRAGELYLHYYCQLYGISYCVLRYANVYGPRQNPHGESGVIAIFLEMIRAGKAPVINGSGDHTRDYVYVSDVVNANVLALNSPFVGQLNIGTQTELSTNDIFRKLVKTLNLDLPELHGPERPGEQVKSSLSFAKAKSILGWEPKVNFEQGLLNVVEWFNSVSNQK